MAIIAAQDDVRANRKERETPTGRAWRTDFIRDEKTLSAPMAFLAEGAPGRVIKPHFHECDQFQVIVSGGGVLGRHPLSIHAVHFTRAHTPYGPIVAGQEGLGFLTLRAQWDQGAQYLPDARAKLAGVADRKPWQTTEAPRFQPTAGMQAHAFADVRDERGLAAWSISLGANASGAAPSPAGSGGQYIIVTRGSLLHDAKPHAPITIIWVNNDEDAFELVAGPEGLEALVLNFPRRENPSAMVAAPSTDSTFRLWQCALCSFVYDESKGIPEEGIPPGTRWEDVPEDWICPDCAAGKADFDMQVVG